MSQQHFAQPVPSPKRRRWPIVLVVLGVVFIAGVGGCVAVLGSIGDDVAKQADRQQDRSTPRPVAVGKAFTIGKHQTLDGWRVVNDGGMFDIEGKVRNVSDTTSTAFFHVKFLTASGEVLGNVDCNSGDLEPGQTEALNCIPNGRFSRYAKVTAEATF